ncbi:hypothetical protein XENOCAPTIV_007332 [Xenoophorus captivus]|uniref:Uncharacterized protein n=1 Tax=Xenoophorus captivus TaxID=1517983 RepID=A0ABV0SEZ6_9TELE
MLHSTQIWILPGIGWIGHQLCKSKNGGEPKPCNELVMPHLSSTTSILLACECQDVVVSCRTKWQTGAWGPHGELKYLMKNKIANLAKVRNRTQKDQAMKLAWNELANSRIQQ